MSSCGCLARCCCLNIMIIERRMADVTYNTASFPSLVRTFSSLTQLCEKPPLMLLGYKERDTSERTLWEMLRQEASFGLVLAGQIQGAGDASVEIWIGQAIDS